MKKVIIFLFAILFVFQSCQDDEFLPIDDFDNVESTETREFKNKNSEKKEFKKLLKEFYKNHPDLKKDVFKKWGSILYDNILYFEWDEAKLGIVPVAANKSEKTEAIILVLISNDELEVLNFGFFERANVFDDEIFSFTGSENVNPVDASIISSYFMIFDKDIFDYYDCELLERHKEVTPNTNFQSKNTKSTCYWVYAETGGVYYYTAVGSNSDPNQYVTYYYVPTYGWWEVCTEGYDSYPSTDESGTGQNASNNSGDVSENTVSAINVYIHCADIDLYSSSTHKTAQIEIKQVMIGIPSHTITLKVEINVPKTWNNGYAATKIASLLSQALNHARSEVNDQFGLVVSENEVTAVANYMQQQFYSYIQTFRNGVLGTSNNYVRSYFQASHANPSNVSLSIFPHHENCM